MAEQLSRWYQADAHPNARPGPGHPRAKDSFWGRSPNYAKRMGACRGRGPTRQFCNAASPKLPARGVEGQKTLFICLYSLHLYLDSQTFPFKLHISVSAKPNDTLAAFPVAIWVRTDHLSVGESLEGWPPEESCQLG